MRVAIAGATYALALLMVSTFRYWSFKEIDFARRRPVETLLVVVLAVMIVATMHEVFLFLVFRRLRVLGPGPAARRRPPAGGGRRGRASAPSKDVRIDSARPTAQGDRSPMSTFKIAVLPGDGIGPEVTAEAVSVLRAVAPSVGRLFEFEQALGGRRRHRRRRHAASARDAEALPVVTPSSSAPSAGPSGTTCRRSSAPERGLLGCARSSTSTRTCARPPASPCWSTPRRSSARSSRAPTSW